MNGSSARKNFNSGLMVLKRTLNDANLMPKREFKDEQELSEFLQNNIELWIDTTEITLQRPDNEQLQKNLYSGKKKRNSLKSMIIANAFKMIIYLSKVVSGNIHDYKLLKSVFNEKSNFLKTIFCSLI